MNLVATLEPNDTVDFRAESPSQVILGMYGDFDGATLSLLIDPRKTGTPAFIQFAADGSDQQWVQNDTRRLYLPGPADYRLSLSNTGVGSVDVYVQSIE